MKIKNSVKIMCGAFTLAALTMSCSKKTVETKTEDNSSKLVTGTIEVDSINNSFNNLSSEWKSMGETLSDELENNIEDIGASFSTLGNTLNGIVDSPAFGTLTDTINSTMDTLTNPDTYSQALDSTKNALDNLTNSTKDKIDSFKDSAADKIEDFKDSTTNKIEDLKNSEAINSLTDSFNSAMDSLKDFKLDTETQDALDSLKDLGNLFGRKN